MKIQVSSVLAGLVFCHNISAMVIQGTEERIHCTKNLTRPQTENASKSPFHLRISKPVVSPQKAPDSFTTIAHPFKPVYADNTFDKVVPTCSWISNLFYPSVDHLAPTTPDPYILRLLDDFGGNAGLSISQPHDKVI